MQLDKRLEHTSAHYKVKKPMKIKNGKKNIVHSFRDQNEIVPNGPKQIIVWVLLINIRRYVEKINHEYMAENTDSGIVYSP